jgi:hypothetical protein
LRELLGVRREACQAPAGFNRHPIRALDAFQRPADGNRFAASDLQLGAGPEISLGFVGAAQLRVRQPAEIISPRIAAAGGDRRREHFVRFFVVACEVSVHAASIHLFEQVVLRETGRAGKCQRRRCQTTQKDLPSHKRRSLCV